MPLDRRDALQVVGGFGLAALAGCLGDTSGDSATTTTTEPTTTTTTTTTTTETTSTTEAITDDEDETKTEHVRIENRCQSERVVSIEVLDAEDSVLLSNTYRVPGKLGLRIQQEFEWETYTVRGRVADEDWHEMTWEPHSCSSTPNPDGNMDAGVVVKSGGDVEIVHNVCDLLELGEVYVDGYEPATEYAIES